MQQFFNMGESMNVNSSSNTNRTTLQPSKRVDEYLTKFYSQLTRIVGSEIGFKQTVYRKIENAHIKGEKTVKINHITLSFVVEGSIIKSITQD
ncbi:hypothetical protein [Faucicola boevrei]|uniref:hypothetical protein n=1 Tax=Faucicola boevrei TaxID=346665 RepID=UPI00036547E9|nr:hypothetical protein [Moraxella boevrei]